MLLLVFIQIVAFTDVLVSDQQEPTGAASGIVNSLHWRRAHYVHNGTDKSARGKVLSGPRLHVLSVLFKQALIGITLDVSVKRHPLFFVDQVGDEAAELGRVLNLVLGL